MMRMRSSELEAAALTHACPCCSRVFGRAADVKSHFHKKHELKRTPRYIYIKEAP